MKHNETSWNIMENPGTSWNIIEHLATWKSMEHNRKWGGGSILKFCSMQGSYWVKYSTRCLFFAILVRKQIGFNHFCKAKSTPPPPNMIRVNNELHSELSNISYTHVLSIIPSPFGLTTYYFFGKTSPPGETPLYAPVTHSSYKTVAGTCWYLNKMLTHK